MTSTTYSTEEYTLLMARKHAVTAENVVKMLNTGISYDMLDAILTHTVDNGMPTVGALAIVRAVQTRSEPSLREVQQEVGKWSVEQFGDNANNISKHDSLPMGSKAALWGIVEEIGELNHVTICRHQGRRGYDNGVKYREDRNDAVGDLMIFLCDYCCREGIDLMDILLHTWNNIVKHRKVTDNRDDWEGLTHHNPVTTGRDDVEAVNGHSDSAKEHGDHVNEISKPFKTIPPDILAKMKQLKTPLTLERALETMEERRKRAEDDGVNYEEENEGKDNPYLVKWLKRAKSGKLVVEQNKKFKCPKCKSWISDSAVEMLANEEKGSHQCPECSYWLMMKDFVDAKES